MTMIIRKRLGELADELTTVADAWRSGETAALFVLIDELRAASIEPSRIPAERGQFVPAANYVGNGGARMADAIERLDDELNAVKLALDAHRAALVAAGWLDVNGNVTAEPAKPERIDLIDRDGDRWYDCGNDRYASSEPWGKAKIEREYGPVRDDQR